MEQLSAVFNVVMDYTKSLHFKESTLKGYDNAYRRIERQLQFPLEEGVGLLDAVRKQVNTLTEQGKTCSVAFPIYSRMLCYLETGIVYEGYLYNTPLKISLSQDTFIPVLDQYLAYLQSDGLSVYTIDSYRNVTTQFLNHLNANGIHDIVESNGSLVVSFFEGFICTRYNYHIIQKNR